MWSLVRVRSWRGGVEGGRGDAGGGGGGGGQMTAWGGGGRGGGRFSDVGEVREGREEVF